MWSAVNWLTSKAGINLEEAQEVINCTSGYYNQQNNESDEQGNEASKENQSTTANGSVVQSSPKKRWRQHKYNQQQAPVPHNLGGAPPMIVPMGAGYRTPTAGTPHPPMPPIMVPTGGRKSSPPPGYGGSPTSVIAGHGLGGSPLGGRQSPPSPWKEMSMTADVNSPGFAFRVVRQAERTADLSSKMYPTVQERHLHCKHRPNIKLRGTHKPVVTSNKPRSVPLLPLASPTLQHSSPHGSPSTSSPLFSQQQQTPHHMTDFRPTDFFVGSSVRNPSGTSFPDLLEATTAATNLALANLSREESGEGFDRNGDLTVTKATLTNIAVTAALTMSDNRDRARNLNQEVDGSKEDPTSLKAVLAALSSGGKGVKRSRINDFDDIENKRQCGISGDNTTNDFNFSSPPNESTSNCGGEKRALETSLNSNPDSSTQGSPCAKIARTSGTTSDSSSPSGKGLGGEECDKRGREDSTLVSPINNKRRCVNPRLASMSSSRKMIDQTMSSVERNYSLIDNKSDSQDSDDDSHSSGSSDILLDDSMDNEEDEINKSDINRSVKYEDSADKSNSSVSSQQRAGEDNAAAVPPSEHGIMPCAPHIVSLTAHRADKQANKTRLNRMLGLLFNMTEEEVESSSTDDKPASLSLQTNTNLPSSLPLQQMPYIMAPSESSSSFNLPSTSFNLPSTSQLLSPGLIASTLFSEKAKEPAVSANLFPTSGDAFSRAKTLPVSELQQVQNGSLGSNSVSASFRFTVPTKSETSSSNLVPAASNNLNSAGLSPKLPSFSEATQSINTTASPKLSGNIDVTKELPTVNGSNPLLTFLAKNVKPAFEKASQSETTSTPPPPCFSAVNINTTTPEKNAAGLPYLNAGTVISNKSDISSGFSFGAVTPQNDIATPSANNPLLSAFKTPQKEVGVVSPSNPLLNFRSNTPATSLSGGTGMFSFGNTGSKVTDNTSVAPVLPSFSFATSKADTSPSGTLSATAPAPSMFSFGPTDATKPGTANTTTSAPVIAPFSFSSSTTNTNSGASAQVTTQAAASTFAFGASIPTTSLSTVDTNTKVQSNPSAAFSFGQSVTGSATTIENKTTASSAQSPFSFGRAKTPASNNPLSTSSFSAIPSMKAPSTGGADTFQFGNAIKPPTTQTSTTAVGGSTFSFATSGSASTTSASTANPQQPPLPSFGGLDTATASSTSSPFSFGNVKTNAIENKASSSSFSFGSSESNKPSMTPNTTAPQATASSFSFGNTSAAPQTSTEGHKPAENALFSFGGSSTSAAPSFGADASNNTPSSVVTFGTAPAVSTNSSTAPSSITFGAVPSVSSGFGAAPSVSTGFGAAPSVSTSFGAAPSVSTSFGATPSVSASFGATPSVSASFGATPSVSTGFGATPTVSTGFGATPSVSTGFGATPSVSTGFGAAPSVSTGFGATPSVSASFGTSNNLFGAAVSSKSTFGNSATVATTKASTNAVFGSSMSTTEASNPFANAAVSATTGTPSSTFAFGSSATNQLPTKSVTFGSTEVINISTASSQSSNSSSNLFGQSNTNQTPATNMFGQTASNSTPSFGSNMFGQSTSNNNTAAASSGSTFQFGGGAPSTSSTNNPSSSSFGFGSANAGTMAPAVPSFGAGASISSFGAAAPSFGSPVPNPAFVIPGPSSFSPGSFTMPGMADQQNVFSVGGVNTNNLTRRPRIRAHRRNK